MSCLLLEDVSIFRVCVAAAAKMLRSDWPLDEWPEILPNVISLASSADPACARRGMHALYLLVKELNSMSALSERQKFVAVGPAIAAVIIPAWQQLLPHLPSSAEAAEALHVIAKVFKHSVTRCSGLTGPGGAVFSFLESCCQVSSFTADICSGRVQCPIYEKIFPLNRTQLSCMRACIKYLPVQVAPVLPNLAGACVQLLGACSKSHAVSDSVASLTCKAISVLETILYENVYTVGSAKYGLSASLNPAQKQQAEAAFSAFFTDATVGQVVELLAVNYCSISPAQLARWSESPEAFSNEFDAQVCFMIWVV
jgi:hypothetical protein